MPHKRNLVRHFKSFRKPLESQSTLDCLDLSGIPSALWELCGVAHDWLIEALTEMRTYAKAHDLPALTEQLELTLQIAQLETAQDEPASQIYPRIVQQSD